MRSAARSVAIYVAARMHEDAARHSDARHWLSWERSNDDRASGVGLADRALEKLMPILDAHSRCDQVQRGATEVSS